MAPYSVQMAPFAPTGGTTSLQLFLQGRQFSALWAGVHAQASSLQASSTLPQYSSIHLPPPPHPTDRPPDSCTPAQGPSLSIMPSGMHGHDASKALGGRACPLLQYMYTHSYLRSSGFSPVRIRTRNVLKRGLQPPSPPRHTANASTQSPQESGPPATRLSALGVTDGLPIHAAILYRP